jgi:8-oxo-dGTP pyrophosphatase MutT (NUDIX family)
MKPYAGKTYAIASALVLYDSRYLIGKRAATKQFAPNRWEFISGFLDVPDLSAEEVILKELQEEVGLAGAILGTADPYLVADAEARWIVIPFLIEAASGKVTLNPADHSELRWVSKADLDNYPEIAEDVAALKNSGLLS